MPNHDAIEALNQLSRVPENIVFVVSEASKYQMHQWFAKDAPRLGLLAENGYYYRWISENKKENDWGKLSDVDDFQWINQVKLIMNQYKNKTDGSFIEEKETSITWNC